MLRVLQRSALLTRLILCVAGGAVGLSNSYLPLPVPTLKDRSVAFPCQDNVCGCRNAAQCWSSCCCHTDQQKLDWARKNGVTPPDSFLQKMAWKKYSTCCAKTESVTKPKAESRAACCCAKVKMETAAQRIPAGCCQSQESPSKTVKAPPAPKDTVVIQALQQCQSVADHFLIVSLKLLPGEDPASALVFLSESVCEGLVTDVLPPVQPSEPVPD